ncbi:hypothetical protein [Arenimonas sp. MALMAid1274]|uniref:hypothetical protein n=1 Tax=Arenimonas sp. MALMAid1274 TaxID=3411630 RepID=UPI003BA06800
MGLPTIFIGGFGMVLLAGAQQMRSWTMAFAAFTVFGFLFLLWAISLQKASQYAWLVARFRSTEKVAARPGAFFKGAVLGLAWWVVGLFAYKLDIAQVNSHGRQVLLLAVMLGVFLLPLLTGWLWSALSAARIPEAAQGVGGPITAGGAVAGGWKALKIVLILGFALVALVVLSVVAMLGAPFLLAWMGG